MFSGVSAGHVAHVTCLIQIENLKKAVGLKQNCTYGLFFFFFTINEYIDYFPQLGKMTNSLSFVP